jgi:hypothetical protein
MLCLGPRPHRCARTQVLCESQPGCHYVGGEEYFQYQPSNFDHEWYPNLFGSCVAADSDHVSVHEEMQDRVLLRWGHMQDLDLWVFDASDYSNAASYELFSTEMAGGIVTLEVDQGAGVDGPETTSLEGVASGRMEVWVNHYSDVFTQAQVAESPATVEVYCERCLNEEGQVREGLVGSVKQWPVDVVEGSAWWKVGEFVAPSMDGTERLEWQPCTSGCYLVVELESPLYLEEDGGELEPPPPSGTTCVGKARAFTVDGTSLCVPPELYPTSNVSHCVFDKSWKDVIKLKGVMETGGLGDLLVEDKWEVWVCGAQMPCALEQRDWVCFTYNELHNVFVPWGYNQQLRLVGKCPRK